MNLCEGVLTALHRKPLRVAFSQVAKADSVTSGGGLQEGIKEEDEEEEEKEEKKDEVFEPDKKLLPKDKKDESSTPPGTKE